METEVFLKDLMHQVGEFGSYQLKQHLLHLSAAILAGINFFSLATVLPTPLHRCFIPGIDNETSPSYHDADARQFIPLARDGKPDPCSKLIPIPGIDTYDSQDCWGSYVYDMTYFKSSQIIEFNLVCDRRWEGELLQSTYMMGVLVGAGLLGWLADRIGRKRVFCASIFLHLVFGLSAAIIMSKNIYVYMATLICYGMFGASGAFVTGLVLSIEIVGPGKRTMCGTAFAAAFSAGAMIVAFWGSFIKSDWLLQTVYALHAVLLLPLWWLVDESPRWLWLQGRVEDAVEIAKKAAKANGREFVDVYSGLQEVLPTRAAHQGIFDLLRSHILRNRLLIFVLCSVSYGLFYHALSIKAGNFVEDPFLSLVLIPLAELVAYAVVIFVMEKTGRRSLNFVIILIGGVSYVFADLLQEDFTASLLVILGKVSIAGSYSIVFYYAAEVLPTVIRSFSVGIVVMAGKSWTIPLNVMGLRLPTTACGAVTIVSALLTLCPPETLRTELPESVEDGENFRTGDNGYKAIWNFISRRHKKLEENDLVQAHDNIALEPLR